MDRAASADYLVCGPTHVPLMIHMHLDAIDGIGRDVAETGPETQGFLLGRVIQGEGNQRAEVWIERYKRRAATDDRQAEPKPFAEAAETIGLYCCSKGLPHWDEAFDLFLLIDRGADLSLRGRFFARDPENNVAPIDNGFPFRGHGVQLRRQMDETDEAVTRATNVEPPAAAAPRHLVHDFLPLFAASAEATEETTERPARRWWPAVAAVALVAGAGLAFVGLSGRSKAPAPPPTVRQTESSRPLGLYVNPSDDGAWRVSWNPAATSLQDASGGQLFVRQGDEQVRIELPPAELALGSYVFRPSANDVTFRLEVTEASGRVSAESFRMTRQAGPPPLVAAKPPATASPAEKAPLPPAKPAPKKGPEPLRVTHRAAPVVAASIRPRITGKVAIDVRVKVDSRGKVVSAEPLGRAHDGVRTYLAKSAVTAARQWRFEPGRNGEETIHFVFTP